VCCSVLQRVAVRCGMLQFVAMCCIVAVKKDPFLPKLITFWLFFSFSSTRLIFQECTLKTKITTKFLGMPPGTQKPNKAKYRHKIHTYLVFFFPYFSAVAMHLSSYFLGVHPKRQIWINALFFVSLPFFMAVYLSPQFVGVLPSNPKSKYEDHLNTYFVFFPISAPWPYIYRLTF